MMISNEFSSYLQLLTSKKLNDICFFCILEQINYFIMGCAMPSMVVRFTSSAGTGYNYWVKMDPKKQFKFRKYDPIKKCHVDFIQKKK